MQYLKDEMRQRINNAALKEFDKKGYTDASMRGIAENANTSVGNLYKYYRSKEELFEKLIGTIYERLVGYIQKFETVKLDENAQAIFYGLVEEIMEIFNENSLEISVLLNHSRGSKYANCKGIFVAFATRIYTEMIDYQMQSKGKKLKDGFMIHLISNSLVESIAIIVSEKRAGAEVKRLILKLIDIFYTDIADQLDYETI